MFYSHPSPSPCCHKTRILLSVYFLYCIWCIHRAAFLLFFSSDLEKVICLSLLASDARWVAGDERQGLHGSQGDP